MTEIRAYTPADRIAVERINFETGFLGSTLEPILETRDIVTDSLEVYFEKEPGEILVAVENSTVIGYLIGSLGTIQAQDAWAVGRRVLTWSLRLPFLGKKDRAYLLNQLRIIFLAVVGKGEERRLKVPETGGHFHINLLPPMRGLGIGTKLLLRFMEHARDKNITRIYANSYLTRINPNGHFWEKNGFSEFCKVKTNYWKKYYSDEDVYLVCYSRTI